MTAEALIGRLDKVRQTGRDRWVACCPAHADKRPSLTVRALEDGRTLAYCFAGCDIEDVIAAAGLEMSVLFADQPLSSHAKLERRPYNAADILECLMNETAIVLDCANQLRAGKALSLEDHARLVTACGRLVRGMDVARG